MITGNSSTLPEWTRYHITALQVSHGIVGSIIESGKSVESLHPAAVMPKKKDFIDKVVMTANMDKYEADVQQATADYEAAREAALEQVKCRVRNIMLTTRIWLKYSTYFGDRSAQSCRRQ
jgi:hypothetical protein